MGQGDADQPLLLSVFDRLLGDEAADASASNRPTQAWWSRDALRHSVRRDLEILLNTRRRCLSWPEDLDDLDRSLVGFGTPDFSGANLASQAQKERFRSDVEQAIQTFEPRFKTVRVSLAESDGIARSLRFRIEALMYADPVPVHLLFDSLLDPSSRRFSVIGT